MKIEKINRISVTMKKELKDIKELFFSNSIDLQCIVDSEGYFKKVNPKWESTLGYTLSEIEGKRLIEFVHPDDVNKTILAIKRLIKSRHEKNFIIRFRHKDGSYHWIEWQSFFSEGIVCFSARDITKRIKAEEEFHLSEQKYRILFENLSSGFAFHELVFDSNGNPVDFRYIDINKKYKEIWEVDDSLIGHTALEVFKIAEKKWVDDAWEAISSGRPVNHTVYRTARDMYVEAIIFRVDDKHFAAIFNDITIRKKTEQALQKSETRFRSMVENMPGSLGVIDLQGNIKYVNTAFTKYFGYKLEEIPTIEKWSLLAYPDKAYREKSLLLWQQDIDNIIESKTPFSIPRVYTVQSKSGVYIDVEISFTIIANELYVLFNDVTDKLKAERERQSNLVFFECMDKVNRIMHGSNNMEQMISDVLDMALSVFGCDRAFLVAPCDPELSEFKIFMERTVPEYPGAYKKGQTVPLSPKGKDLFTELLNTPGPVEINYEKGLDPDYVPWKTFEIKSQLAIALYPKVGRPWEFGLHQCSYSRVWKPQEKKMFQEISRRLADSLTNLLMYYDLRNSEEFLNNIVENIPNMIVVKDAEDLRFLRLNGAGEKLLGYHREEMLGKNDYDIFQKEQADFFTSKDREALSIQKLINIPEETIKLKNNEERIINTKKIPILDETGKSKYLLAISEDITERKHAEEQILKLNRELEKKVEERTAKLNILNKDLESFAYSVSHDLRAPIRHIDGFVRLMYSEIVKPKEKIIDYYNKIEAAIQRMSSMIDSLLSFSRVGRIELAISEVDLESLVYEIIDQYKPDIGKRRIEWKISKLPCIKCDRNLIKLVFDNLISNAIKYTSKRQKSIIQIGSKPGSEGKYEIFIKDNGVGFDMAYLGKLFGVFQRLHASEEFDGIGIGLANVRQIIEKHGGTVRAEGKVNKGATFYLTLPSN